MHTIKYRPAKTALCVALALGGSAIAADTWEPAAKSDTVELGTVQIQGRRTNTPKESGNNYTVRGSKQAAKLDLELKETPQSITVFTQQQMQDQGLQDIQEVLQETPGITVLQSSLTGMDDAAYYSRGFQVDNYQLDGVMGSSNLLGGSQFVGMQDSFLYDRAEVVRGSTGLTTGTGDPAASVNFIRKRPLAENRGEFNLKYGSWASRRAEFDYSHVLNRSGTLRGRIVGTLGRGNSFMDQVRRNSHSYALAFDWMPSEKNTISFGFSNQYRHTKGAPKRGVARHATTGSQQWVSIWQPASYWGGCTSYDDGCEPPPTPNGGYVVDYVEGEYQSQTMPINFNNAAQWAYLKARSRNFFVDWQHRFNKHLTFNASYTQTNSSLDHLYADIGINGYYPQLNSATFDYGRNKYRRRTQAADINLDGRFKLWGHDQQIIVGFNGMRSKTYSDTFSDYNTTDSGAAGNSSVCTPTIDYPNWEDSDYDGRADNVNQDTGEIIWVKGELNKEYMAQCFPTNAFNNGDIPRIHYNPAYTLPLYYGGRYRGWGVDYHNYQHGPYFAFKLKPLSWLTMIGGGRWTNYQAFKRGHGRTYDKGRINELVGHENPDGWPEYTDNIHTGMQRSAQRVQKFVPYGGLILQLAPNINAYASYTGILKDNDVIQNYPHNYRKGGGWMPPLEGNSKEFGIKGAFYQGRLNAALSYFTMTQKNYPSFMYTGVRCDNLRPDGTCADYYGFEREYTPGPGYTNKGWDVSIAGQLTPKWRLSAGYVNLKTEQPFPDEVEFQNDVGDNVNMDHSNTYTHPRHTFKMFTSYDFTPKFTAGIGVRWSSGIKPKPFGRGCTNGVCEVYDKRAEFHQPAYAVWNAMARWNFHKQASLGVTVNNLFNKKYWSNDRGNFYGAPRNATVSVNMKW